MMNRHFLWMFSSVLFLAAGGVFWDSVQRGSLLGLLFSGVWLGTILINSIFFDHLLRQQKPVITQKG